MTYDAYGPPLGPAPGPPPPDSPAPVHPAYAPTAYPAYPSHPPYAAPQSGPPQGGTVSDPELVAPPASAPVPQAMDTPSAPMTEKPDEFESSEEPEEFEENEEISGSEEIEEIEENEEIGGSDGAEDASPPQSRSNFILYLEGAEYDEALSRLMLWVRHLLLPVYGREVSSSAPWCPSWWKHPEAVAQLYGLWMAWQDLTDAKAGAVGPSTWHRDYLAHVMASLRDPTGPFAGCKPGSHREKAPPTMDEMSPAYAPPEDFDEFDPDF